MKWSEARSKASQAAKKRRDIVAALEQVCRQCKHLQENDLGEPYCDLIHKGGCRNCPDAEDKRPALWLRLLHNGRCGKGKWDTLLRQAGAL